MLGAGSSPFHRAIFCCSSLSPWNSKASLPEPPPASKIFVRNLSYSTSEATLLKLFSRFGQVVEVTLAKHEKENRSKGYAFIQYSSQDSALSAIEEMDHEMVQDRVVFAEIAKPLKSRLAAYPRGSGPPSQQQLDARSVDDILEEGNLK